MTSPLRLGLLVLALAGIGLLASSSGRTQEAASAQEKKDEKPPQYIGTKSCKLCHSRKSIGAHYKVWAKGPHAQAFETLASDAALKIGAERGLTEPPQKSAECLSCHVTGHGLDKKRYGKDYDAAQGVTCEACHGPAERYWEEDKHTGAAASSAELQHPGEKTCLGCHNEKSPTFRKFGFEAHWKKIVHKTPEK